jgi:maleylacetate reductase
MQRAIGDFQGEYLFLPQEHILFGTGSINRLADEVRHVGGQRVLIITGHSLATKTDVIATITQQLGTLHAGTFVGIRQHAPQSDIARAAEAAHSLAADVLVSVGGGSPIDATKAVARILLQEQGSVIPHIAIPTTLSAAEFSHLFGVTDEERHQKMSFADTRVAPRVVILDARLTLPTPMQLWLSSGIRALDHAVESLYAPGVHPINDVLALEAIRKLFANLPRSKEHPDDLTARTELQIAAWMSFFGVNNTTLGLSHNIGRRIGASYGVPHGITSCITLPHVMRLFAPQRAASLAQIVRTLSLPDAGTDDLKAALAAADAVSDLISRLGLPQHLREVGINEDALPAIARDIAGQGLEITEAEELLQRML